MSSTTSYPSWLSSARSHGLSFKSSSFVLMPKTRSGQRTPRNCMIMRAELTWQARASSPPPDISRDTRAISIVDSGPKQNKRRTQRLASANRFAAR